MSDIELKFDEIYYWCGNLGAWFKSKEKLPKGTVRYIRDDLFYVYARVDGYCWWCPCDEKKSTPPEIEIWRQRKLK